MSGILTAATSLHGFDISAYQSSTAPAADFVVVKATEGSTYTSSRFAAQWRSAGSRAKHRGAYHFARPEASSAKSQAARFLDIVRPVPGESVWLDLEASDLTQARTHDWAAAWGDYIREQIPDVTSGVYMGSGYASSNTGRDLSTHFTFWWYPQYPGKYQVSTPSVDVEELRAANRSHAFPYRTPIAAMTSAWPPAVSPWLPSGLTCGWAAPHVWQFTDNWQGRDASVTALSLEQLAGGGRPVPLPSAKPWPGRYLKVASPLMHGLDVKWVQEHLNGHGANPKVHVDSEYGAKTRDAVRAFQRAHKLTVDGVVGPSTWTALGK